MKSSSNHKRNWLVVRSTDRCSDVCCVDRCVRVVLSLVGPVTTAHTLYPHTTHHLHTNCMYVFCLFSVILLSLRVFHLSTKSIPVSSSLSDLFVQLNSFTAACIGS